MAGTQGGSPEQHAKAGEQSHKNSGGGGGNGGQGSGDGRGQVKDPKHDGRLKQNR